MPQEPKKSIMQQLFDMVTLREVEKRRGAQGAAPFGAIAPPKAPTFDGPPPTTGPPGANFRRDIDLPSPASARAQAIAMLQKTGQQASAQNVEAMMRRLHGGR